MTQPRRRRPPAPRPYTPEQQVEIDRLRAELQSRLDHMRAALEGRPMGWLTPRA